MQRSRWIVVNQIPVVADMNRGSNMKKIKTNFKQYK